MRILLLALPGLGVLPACRPDSGLQKVNSLPEAQITAPSEGSAVLEGTTITLRGAASDPNHDAGELLARWFLGETEACASAVPAADGTTTCEVRVPAGDSFAARLEVVDPDGAAATASATWSVTPNAAPEVRIESPTADGVYYSDQLVILRATVGDVEDAADTLVVRWESSLDGALGEATPNSEGLSESFVNLGEGAHAVQAFVTDSAGNEGQATVLVDVGPPNSAPTCAITAPGSGGAGALGAAVAFVGSATDVDVSANLLAVRWTSDKDGDLGASTPDSAGNVGFTTSALSADDHRITMTVTDEVGVSCAAAVDWTVGTPPSVALELPLAGEVANEGEPLTFRVSVSDAEDLSSALVVAWESDRDGVFYVGTADSTGVAQTIDAGLSVGDHVVTVTVTDTDGLFAAALGTFTVNGAPTAPTVSILPAAPSTDDDLRAAIDLPSIDAEGDPLTYTYVWQVDGVVSGASTSASLPAAATAHGEVWTVSVSATDGFATSAAGTASVTILNTAPIGAVALGPAAPTRRDTLSCVATGMDADGDPLDHAFVWFVGGATVPASSGDSASSTLAGAFSAGDTVTCIVTTDDGHGGTDTDTVSVTIGNTAPVVSSVTLTPAAVYTDDTLYATVSASDADGDALSTLYDWYVDGALVQSGASATLSGATHFSRDQTVHVVATVDDSVATASGSSAGVTVLNTAPTAPVVAITPDDAASGDDLTCSVVTASADADGDPIAYTFAWDVDGVAHSGAADAATSSVVDGADVGGGETWTCEVVAGDGTDVTSVATTLATAAGMTWVLIDTETLTSLPSGSVTTNGAWLGQGVGAMGGRSCWRMRSDNNNVWMPLPIGYTTFDGLAVEVNMYVPSGQKNARVALGTAAYGTSSAATMEVLGSTASLWGASTYPDNGIRYGESSAYALTDVLSSVSSVADRWITVRMEVNLLSRRASYMYDGVTIGETILSATALVDPGYFDVAANTSCCSVPADVCYEGVNVYRGY